jgi:nitrite reductase/ring-hydroxylating ferredoxin subunit
MLALGSLAAACGSPTGPSGNAPPLNAASATVSGRVVSITLASASALSAVGSAASVQTAIGSFIVVRTAQETFAAFTAICTHEGCTITGFSGSRLVCPCHGSEFTTSGSVAKGPATSALRSFPTQFANGVVTFTA